MKKRKKYLQEGNGMKWYKVVFTTRTGETSEQEVLTKAQAIMTVKAEGFQWSEQLEDWEQTYCYVDPFDDYEVDRAYIKAEITVVSYGKEVTKGL